MNVEFHFYNQQLLSNLKETPAQNKFYSAMPLVWKVPKQFDTVLIPLFLFVEKIQWENWVEVK